MSQHKGSFRDPAGNVIVLNDRIYRTVTRLGATSYEAVRNKAAVLRAQKNGALISARELPREEWPSPVGPCEYLLEHPRLAFISHPYEWSFEQLKAASLHHLDLQLSLIEDDVVLSDSSAFNIQFVGCKPIFIDFLSMRPYEPGCYWHGHKQFCDEFLNPLLMQSALGIPFNEWYRGTMRGIDTSHLARILPWRMAGSLTVLSNVFLQAWLERRTVTHASETLRKTGGLRPFPKSGYIGLLRQLRGFLSKLKPLRGRTRWDSYARCNTYSESESSRKLEIVKRFVGQLKPRTLIDLGCNSGAFSFAALDAGAQRVIGFDSDVAALNSAYEAASVSDRNFLALYQDAFNPSPNQGWLERERESFSQRVQGCAVIALAFLHHLVIAKNAPLFEAVRFVVDLAPTGIIEFVPKTDPTVQVMLANRQDVFPCYTEESFSEALRALACIVRVDELSPGGRKIFQFARVD